jgi:tRNA-2-methylthio-N6-dimethylallyladenosine synthase
MGRRYTRAEYLGRTQLLLETVPGLTLSTDIIVGFPGESDEQFEQTLSLVSELGFVGVFGFKYSQRPYTPALKFADDVSEAAKSQRLTRLLDLSEQIRSRHLQSLVGTSTQVLVEGRSKTGAFTGRTLRNEIVHFGCQGDPTGSLLEIRIERALKHSLVGELTDAELRVSYEQQISQAAAAPASEAAAPRSLPVLS